MFPIFLSIKVIDGPNRWGLIGQNLPVTRPDPADNIKRHNCSNSSPLPFLLKFSSITIFLVYFHPYSFIVVLSKAQITLKYKFLLPKYAISSNFSILHSFSAADRVWARRLLLESLSHNHTTPY